MIVDEDIFRAQHPDWAHEDIEPTSVPTRRYNCLAYAFGDKTRWWEPYDSGGYWPEGVEPNCSLETVVGLFKARDYEVCTSQELEEGYDKVAIYQDDAGDYSHVASQLASGWWASKLGQGWNIEHRTLAVIEDTNNGKLAVLLKRQRAQTLLEVEPHS